MARTVGIEERLVVETGGHVAEVTFEPFDSELLAMNIGRTVISYEIPRLPLHALLSSVTDRARGAGYDQLLRRVAASSFDEVWALESSGYELMDIGVTFARRIDATYSANGVPHVDVRPATADDIDKLLETMLDVPWGSRYEADPAYDRTAVQGLQARWLRNSLVGRADHVLIGHVDGEPAGYVTCRLVEEHGETVGEIDLVGTVPAFRGRGVAAAIVQESLAWFSTRVSIVTVRTQATNTVAAGLYERAGMTLRHADLTLRRALTTRGGRQ